MGQVSMVELSNMLEIRERRSPRLAHPLPIRVFGTNVDGKNFFELSTTVVVNREGALILLNQIPAPQKEIFIYCPRSDRGGRFRVVGDRQVGEGSQKYWGVECTSEATNVWGVSFPELTPDDRGAVRVLLACPVCGSREHVFMTESQVEILQEKGRLPRDCRQCKITSLWQEVPYVYET